MADVLNLELRHPGACNFDRIDNSELTLTFAPKHECTSPTEHNQTPQDDQQFKAKLADYKRPYKYNRNLNNAAQLADYNLLYSLNPTRAAARQQKQQQRYTYTASG